MLKRFEDIIKEVIKIEGGYVDNPSDRGGPTKFGISQRTYPDLDIKNLTYSDAVEIYFKDFWVKYKCDEIPEKFRHLYFDMLINHGPRNAIKILQRALVMDPQSQFKNLRIDGVYGEETNYALVHSPHFTVLDLISQRLIFYCGIIQRSPKQRIFLSGWVKRCFSFLS